ncbi:MAG TPA: iron-sulfur cluster assembly scaffold protein [Terriglobales bacterium]|nr:iron-sulfur cluster assembly scaffold protein [Terriglobales bacterium]
MYSAQVLDHFQNPRSVGEVENATVTVEVQNPACGDVLRLSLRIENGRIEEAKFRAKGCVPSIACGSRLVETLAGLTVKEAAGVRREDLVASVGGLPEASQHASHLALDALKAALAKLS